MTPWWYVVRGRGSGLVLPGQHLAHVDRPFGKMETFCGVVISSAFTGGTVRNHGEHCKACKRVARRSET